MDSELENILRAILVSFLIIGIMIGCVYCLYKYAVCQENNNRHQSKPVRVINVSQGEQLYITVQPSLKIEI